MNPNIFIFSFLAQSDIDSAIIFQNFGSSVSNHPNYYHHLELTEDDDTDTSQTLAKDFKIQGYPSIIFAQVVSESPFVVVPIARTEQALTSAGLQKIYDDIVSGTIPIPEVGNQGVIADSNGEVVGDAKEESGFVIGGAGGVFNFNFNRILLFAGIGGALYAVNKKNKKKRNK